MQGGPAKKNPNGIPAQSPGLRACELPWVNTNLTFNHNVVAANIFHRRLN